MEWEQQYWLAEIEHHGIEHAIACIAQSDEAQRFRQDRELMFVPAGHFYSPIVDVDFVRSREHQIFERDRKPYGVDLNESEQLALLQDILPFFDKLPFSEKQSSGYRYCYDNDTFVYGDGVILAVMLMKFRPKRIVEIGSGFSSALILDVCDIMDDYAPAITFIDRIPSFFRN